MNEVDVHTLAAVVDDATLIDVREADEYVAGHIPGAIPMPMAQVPTRAAELDRDRPVYVVCASGNRSGAITDLLTAMGYDARNVAGGTKAWLQSGRPVERGADR